MATEVPTLNIKIAVEQLGAYFGALEASAFYNMLLDEVDITNALDPSTRGSDDTFTADVAGHLVDFIYDSTQGGMTTSELLDQIPDDIKPTLKGGQQQVTAPAGIDDNVFNKSILFTYENLPDTAALNAFDEQQGWSSEGESDGSYIFSVSKITGGNLNQNKSSPPSKAKPGLAAIQVFDPRLSFSNRSTNALQVFMNGIPPVEMSRCVPFFNVQLITGRNALDSENRPQTPSLFRFLEGSPRLDLDGDAGLQVDAILASGRPLNSFDVQGKIAAQGDPESGDQNYAYAAVAGMELFTSPQTLVNANEEYHGLDTSPEAVRSASVLDKFRPFMSIKSFDVMLTPSNGMMSKKSGQMGLVLHDRSRLGEIAAFVKPDLYKGSELLIEYGWAHPEGGASATGNYENAFGSFLNTLRKREKWGIKNSSFNFNVDGSVDITLDLYTLGSADMGLTSIAKGEGVASVAKDVAELAESIRKAVGTIHPGYAKDIQGFQMLSSVADTKSAASFDSETLKKLKEFYKSSSTSIPAISDIKDKLTALYGPEIDGKAGKVKDLNDTVANAVRKKESKLGLTDDPFLRPLSFKGASKGKAAPDVMTEGKRKRGYVSLGRVLLDFVGAPLAETNKFDEVQFIFYPFNSRSSYMHDFNIAQFPIHIETFIKRFADLKKVTANLPLGEFMSFLNQNFLNTQDSHAYGLVHTFADGDNKRTKVKWFEEGTRMADEINRVLKHAYRSNTASARFDMPSLTAMVEAVPVNYKVVPVSGVGSSGARTILRIHVMDEVASSHDALIEVLQATRAENMGMINTSTANVKTPEKGKTINHSEKFKQVITRAVRENLLEPVPMIDAGNAADSLAKRIADEKLIVRVKGGYPAVKKFVAAGMPKIIIGGQASTVVSAKLSSMQNPALGTIMMLEQGAQQGMNAQGAQIHGLPLKVQPTQLDIEVLGCPLFERGQQIFVDFGTGTTADNVYIVNDVKHKVTPGEFKTTAQLRSKQAFGQYFALADSIEKALSALADSG